MSRRSLIIVGSLLGALLLCCGLLWFVAVPRARNAASDSVQEAIGTEVAERVAPDGSPVAGEYTITATELSERISNQMEGNDAQLENFVVTITPELFQVKLNSGEQDATYSGKFVAVDGELDVQDMESSSGILNFLFPAGDVAKAIERGVNDYLDEQNLILTGLSMTEGAIQLTVEPAA